jgi:hypothetical protein
MAHTPVVLPEPGHDVSALLLYPPPAAEELTSSWLIRLAKANEVSPSALTRTLGFPGLWAQDVDRTLTGANFVALAQATQLPVDRVAQTSLRPLLEQLNGQVNPVGRNLVVVTPESSVGRSRGGGHPVCPECLRTSGLLFRGWRLATTVVCEQHHCRLIDLCPHCGVPISLARPRVHRQTRRTLKYPDLNRCTACGQQLGEDTEYLDEALPGQLDALALQRLVFDAAVTGSAELDGIRLSVRELMCLVTPLLTLCDLRRPLARTLAERYGPAAEQVVTAKGAVLPLERTPVLQRWPVLTRVGELLRGGLSGCLELLRAAGADSGTVLSSLAPGEGQGWFRALIFESLASFPGVRRLTPSGLQRPSGSVVIPPDRWAPLAPLLATEPDHLDTGSRSQTDRQALDDFLTCSLTGTAQKRWQGTSSFTIFSGRMNRWGSTGQLDRMLDRMILQFERDLGGPLPGTPETTAALPDDDARLLLALLSPLALRTFMRLESRHVAQLWKAGVQLTLQQVRELQRIGL